MHGFLKEKFMKQFFCIVVALMIGSFAFAQETQQAKQVLLSSVTYIQKTPLKVAFNLAYINTRTSEKQQKQGTLLVYGKKFCVTMVDMETFFDGKTQWVFVPVTNEVTITEPSEQELCEINPLLLVSDCARTHKIVFEENAPENRSLWYICLYPLDKLADYFQIKIHLSKKDKSPQYIEISQKNGDKISFTCTSCMVLQSLPESTFFFNVKNHPAVEINDLR